MLFRSGTRPGRRQRTGTGGGGAAGYRPGQGVHYDKDKTKQLHDAISQGFVSYGMQTFDQSLMKLFTSKLITYEEALRQSSNPDDFALKVSGISSTSDATWDNFEHKEEQVEAVLKEDKLEVDRY